MQRKLWRREYTTIDEMLETFRRWCIFRQYLPNKPAKIWLKIYAFVDSLTFYTSNLDIYADWQRRGRFKLENSANAVVKRLADHILNAWRNIMMDNFLISISLAKELLEKRTIFVDTIKKERNSSSIYWNKDKGTAPRHFGFTKNSFFCFVQYKPVPKSFDLLNVSQQ